MLQSILRARRLRKGGFSDLDAAESSPTAVRRLWLHGSSWDTEDHSYDRCRELLPHCSRLIEFQIGWLNWTSFPAELASIATLESVVSLNAPIEEFPYFLRDCPRLKRLAIRGGDVRRVDEAVIAFKALRDLDLANNPLTQIPRDLEVRLKLTRLELHDTPISLAARGLDWSRPDYPAGISKQGEQDEDDQAAAAVESKP